MHVNHFRRMQAGLFALALSLLPVVGLKAQTANLTPGQAAAIKAEEDRYNREDLGEVRYGSVSFQLDTLGPPPKGSFLDSKKPGIIVAYGVEHLSGGPSKYPGFRAAKYRLTPQGTGWTTGFADQSSVARIGTIYPTAKQALAELNPPEPVNPVALGLATVGGYVLAALVVGGIGWLLWYGLNSGIRWRRKVATICPRCSALNPFLPTPCDNCGNPNTVVERQTQGPLLQKCFKCNAVSSVDTQCFKCGTELANLIGGGRISKAALDGARRGASFRP